MGKIKSILIPTDFSKASQSAVNYATKFLEDGEKVTITLLHVSPTVLDKDMEDKVNRRFESLAEAIREQKEVLSNWMIKAGDLTESVLATILELDPDLVIVGTKGGHLDGGETNTSRLVLEADCPVLVIPEENTTFKINSIALALGKNEIDDTYSLGVLHDIARKFGAKIHILTINNDESDEIEDKNESALEYYLETLDYQYSFPRNSDIEIGIFDYVKNKNIDLLAILPRNHAKKSTPSEGRLTELLTMHTEIPLLAID